MDYSGSDQQEPFPIGPATTSPEVFDPYPPAKTDDTEFNRKYPLDRFGEEASDTARVWNVYRDAATEADKVELDGWNKTLDVLLIFAALFSAVSTAFILESYKLLQQDSTDYLAATLYDVVQWSKSSLSLEKLDIPAPGVRFQVDDSARWVNGLWFLSLVLSLAVAFLCILAKQWLDEYYARVSRPAQTPRAWAIRHVLYSRGLQQWQVGGFIALLPVGLHVSLFCFLGGLVVFLWRLDEILAGVVVSVTGILLTFYATSNVVPVIWSECPAATALVRTIISPPLLKIAVEIAVVFRTLRRGILSGARARLLSVASSLWTRRERPSEIIATFLLRRLYHMWTPSESHVAQQRDPQLEAEALYWMICTLEQSAAVVGLHALGGYMPSSDVVRCLKDKWEIYRRIGSYNGFGTDRDHIALSRHVRAMFCLQLQHSLAVADIYRFDRSYSRDSEAELPLPASIPLTYDLPFLLRLIRVRLSVDGASNTSVGNLEDTAQLLAYATNNVVRNAVPRDCYFSTSIQILAVIQEGLSPPLLLFLLKAWSIQDADRAFYLFLRKRIQKSAWPDAQDIARNSTCAKCFTIELWCNLYLTHCRMQPLDTALVIRQLQVMVELHNSSFMDIPSSTGIHSQYYAALVLAVPSLFVSSNSLSSWGIFIWRAAVVLGCMFVHTGDAQDKLPWYPAQAQALCHLIDLISCDESNPECLRPDPAIAVASAAAVCFNTKSARDEPLSHPVYPVECAVVPPVISRPLVAPDTVRPERSLDVEHWNDPFCFLRPGLGGATSLRLLLDRISHANTTSEIFAFARLLDALAAQLCTARRRHGNQYPDALVHELLWPEYASCVLSGSAGLGRMPTGYGYPYDTLLLRYAQHCMELSEQLQEYSSTSWWTFVGLNALERSPDCRPYIQRIGHKLSQRGKCTSCDNSPREAPLLEVQTA